MRQMIQVMALLLLVGLSTVQSAHATSSKPWEQDQLCGSMLPKPGQASIPNCQEAYCVSVSESARLCSCRGPRETDEAEMFLEGDGSVMHRWNAVFGHPGSPADFRVDVADLTGKGTKDLLVATRTGVSNGMAVQYWEVRAVVGNRLSNPITVEDYGVMGYLTGADTNKQCLLLATRWDNGWEPKRGYGLYLWGQWFAFNESTGEAYPVLDRPPIFRRYLYSFEKQRLEEYSKERPLPLLWFKDKGTKELSGTTPK